MSRRDGATSLLVWSFVLGFALSGCSETSQRGGTTLDAGAKKSLYDRLGGEAAITKVVDDFVARAASDPKVNFTRKGTAKEWQATDPNVSHLKKMLVQFISFATGGPQQYAGRDMKTVHAGMKITGPEFDALAADLKASLDALKVPAMEQAELLTIVGSTRKDIVE
jgi:hemoglobin